MDESINLSIELLLKPGTRNAEGKVKQTEEEEEEGGVGGGRSSVRVGMVGMLFYVFTEETT